jgi:hypothetical protein
MALRAEDQFYFLLTSDGTMDRNPENKSSDFKVSLKQEIDIGVNDDWEVALTNINYPYSWMNVGPVAKTRLKYYMRHIGRTKELEFPSWHCETLTELVEFIDDEFREQEKGEGMEEKPRIWIKLDKLKRVKIACLDEDFDIGMSEALMRLLGLTGCPYAARMTLEAFEKRDLHRRIMNFLLKDEKERQKLPENQNLAQTGIRMRTAAKYVEDQFAVLEPFFDKQRMIWTIEAMRMYQREGGITEDLEKKLRQGGKEELWQEIERMFFQYSQMSAWLSDVDQAEESGEPVLHFRGISEEERQTGVLTPLHEGMGWVVYHADRLTHMKRPPPDIRGVVPGNLNPVERMFIYTNIVEPMDVNEASHRLLRMINTRGKVFTTTEEEFMQPIYLPVKKGKISRIEILIANAQRERVPFEVGTVILTLHFRRRERRERSTLRTAIYV